MNKLEQIKNFTTVVSDTSEFSEIKKFHPTDATTNPSLVLAAASIAEYQPLLQEAIAYGKKQGSSKNEQKMLALDKVFVNFGLEILKIIPGRVSTEVDARFSFDVDKSVDKAKRLIKLYQSAGIDRDRILIKLASTWEGICACAQLEKEGIHCNMTLMFSLTQAVACADAKATLVSPFVGRILDWYKKKEGKDSYASAQDPGVLSVTEIYNYYKKMNITTQIMGASFRNTDQILELVGCDLLTISPALLDELYHAEGFVGRKLDPEVAKQMSIQKISLDEKTFRWMMNENTMATEKLAEGIRNFSKDIIKLEEIIEKLL